MHVERRNEFVLLHTAAWMSFFIRCLLRGSPKSGNLACILDNGSMSFLCESFWYEGWVFC
ncbi:hypothetical protein O997_02005 [Anaplasma phagocytophilum str. MRK]|nr:hypothetical protein O997_02005 [Anaplasma phagocytophilum str. MRK]